MKILNILILIISCSILVNSQYCENDYNCYNQPYQFCENKWVIDARGLAFGNNDGKIYFTARYNQINSNGKLGESYLVSVNKDVNSNFPGTNIVYKITDEVANGPVYNRVNGIAGINQLPNGQFLIVQDMYKYLPLVGTFNNNSNQFTTAFKQSFENGIFIDGNTMYRCIDTRLESVTPIPLTLESTFTSKSIYKTSYCNALTKFNNKLYFTQLTQIQGQSDWVIGFFVGDINCNNCTLPTPLFTIPSTLPVNGIAADNEFIYYSTANGLFRIPINGDTSNRRKLSDNPNIKSILKDQNSIYYASSTSIVKISLPNQYITELYESTATVISHPGTCKCVNSFTGNNCQTCNGTVQWKYDTTSSQSYPVCNLFLPNGVVSYCDQDWECLSQPWGYCSLNSCLCRKGFSGDRCQYCSSNNITWSDQGIPTCNLYYHGYTTTNA